MSDDARRPEEEPDPRFEAGARRVRRLALFSGRIVLLLLILLFLGQRWLLFPRDASPVPLPDGGVGARVRAVTLRTEDGLDLTAWFHPGSPRALVILFPGNGGNRGGRYEFVQMIRNQGCSVLQVEYRGYGGNPGKPSEAGLYLDAEAALAWARAKLAAERPELPTEPALILMGESLGTGVAVEMATRHPVDGLVLHSGYPSIPAVARAQLGGLPIGWLGRDRFESARKIGGLTCPKLFLHGKEDAVIPLRLGDALYIAAAAPKERVTIERAGHNDLWIADVGRYFGRLRSFLESCTERSAGRSAGRGPGRGAERDTESGAARESAILEG
ncbi:MAG: alpha/beta hydrolase [Planctomycetota bacterium]